MYNIHMYISICICHYLDNKDDSFIVGEYNTIKEAIEHALCWELSKNYNYRKNYRKEISKYDELIISLKNLNFESSNEIDEFMKTWEQARYNYLYSEGKALGYFVKIMKKQNNLEIDDIGKAWYSYLTGKPSDAVLYFKEYYKFLKKLGLD